MKRSFISNLTLLVFITVLIISSGCRRKSCENKSFTFAFLTDIHVQPELNAAEGLKKAIDTLNKIKPDFVITGGDLIMDALGQTYERADSLYNLYAETIKELEVPVYNTIGNHELYGILSRSGADTGHPDYGEQMFENRLGDSYYSFEHKGWKFMILNSVEDTGKDKYVGLIDKDQIEWIISELKKTGPDTPIALSTHIPFITAFTQKYEGSTVPNDSVRVIANGKEILDLFQGHDLRLVLQGHLHTVEDIYIDGIHFITGGAVSAAWWKGPHRGFEEGFLLIKVNNNDLEWEYVDYNWIVNN